MTVEGTEAVEAKKELLVNTGGYVTLSTGYRVKLTGVPAGLIQTAQARVKNPPVPMWYNAAADREEPNPSHPDYIAALQEAEERRSSVALDIMAMFGFELPENWDDGVWLKKLKLLQMQNPGEIPLDEYDLEDADWREFLFRRWIALGMHDFTLIAAHNNMSEEGVKAHEASFPGTAAR